MDKIELFQLAQEVHRKFRIPEVVSLAKGVMDYLSAERRTAPAPPSPRPVSSTPKAEGAESYREHMRRYMRDYRKRKKADADRS